MVRVGNAGKRERKPGKRKMKEKKKGSEKGKKKKKETGGHDKIGNIFKDCKKNSQCVI